jgi:hypothetical protein
VSAPLPPGLGDIGIVPVRGAGGWLIGLGERLAGGGRDAAWRHAFVVTSVGASPSSTRIVEAEPSGARESALSEYSSGAVLWLRCPAAYREGVAGAAAAMLGTRYSWLDYVAVALHHWGVSAGWLERYIAAGGHEMCSAYADEAARRGGWHLFGTLAVPPGPEVWEGAVMPADLAALAEKQGATP